MQCLLSNVCPLHSFRLKHLLSPLYPAYEMQQRESVYAFAVDNQHHAFVCECLQLKGIILGNEMVTQHPSHSLSFFLVNTSCKAVSLIVNSSMPFIWARLSLNRHARALYLLFTSFSFIVHSLWQISFFVAM